MPVIVAAPGQLRITAVVQLANVSRQVLLNRNSDTPFTRAVGGGAMNGPAVMQRHLPGFKNHIYRLGFVQAFDGLSPGENVVLSIPVVVDTYGVVMRAGHHLHTTAFPVAGSEGKPGRHPIVRVQGGIGHVLMPAHKCFCLRFFYEQHRTPYENVLPNEIFHRIQDDAVVCHPVQAFEHQVSVVAVLGVHLVLGNAVPCPRDARE